MAHATVRYGSPLSEMALFEFHCFHAVHLTGLYGWDDTRNQSQEHAQYCGSEHPKKKDSVVVTLAEEPRAKLYGQRADADSDHAAQATRGHRLKEKLHDDSRGGRS